MADRRSFHLQEVEESMKDPSCILDNVARQYQIITQGSGRRCIIVHPTAGRFCVPFPLVNGNRKICFRVWKEIIDDAFKRYELISKKIESVRLPYFSHFRYIPQALRMKCNDQIVPGIVMDWIEGQTLDAFLKERWKGLTLVKRLTFIRDFYWMIDELREVGIAHGDLSCQNIMVTDKNELRLVDYDSLYVSTMGRNFKQTTGGQPAFQHPDRTKRELPVSIDDDNFSQLVIALSLWTAYFDVNVVDKFDEQNMLFNPADLEGGLSKLRNSPGWKEASKHQEKFGHIKKLMRALESIDGPVEKVPSLLTLASRETIRSVDFYSLLDGQPAPRVKLMDFCTSCGTKFKSPDFLYCPNCGTKRGQYTE